MASYLAVPYQRGDNHYRQAQRIIMIMTGRCMGTWKVTDDPRARVALARYTYGDLCDETGYGRNAGRTRGHPLGIAACYCVVNDFPVVNMLVIRQDTGAPGYRITRVGKTLHQEQLESVAFPWYDYPPPSVAKLRAAVERYNAMKLWTRCEPARA